MKLELKLDLLLSALILAFAIPAWTPVVWETNLWPKLWKPLSLVTLSLIGELAFVNSITFGPLTLDYSLRFAAVGIPLSILAIVLVLRRSIGPAAVGLVISSVLCLTMWFFLITVH